MDRSAKCFITLSSLIFSASVLLSTVYGRVAPPALLYLSIIALFGVGVYQSVWQPKTKPLYMLLLGAFLPIFLALGPAEPGLYGNDPYAIVMFTDAFQQGLPADIHTGRFGTRPLIYALVTTLTLLPEADIVPVAKYLPLVNVLVPFAAFLIFRELSSKRVGLLAGFGVAAHNSMFIFQSKFVLQAIAFPMFMVLVLAIVLHRHVESSNRRALYAILPLALAVPFAHKVTSVLLLLLFAVWIGVSVPAHWFGTKREALPELTIAAAISGISVLLVFLLWDSETFVRLVLAVAGLSTAPDVGSGAVPTLTAFDLVAIYGNLVILAVLCLVNVGVLWPENRREWSLAFAGYNALIMVLYIGQSLAGSITALDATRFPLFAIPFLVGIAGFVLLNHETQTPSLRNVAVFGLVFVFIVGQVGLVPFHVLAADGTQPLGESHYYEDSRSAVHWVDNHSSTTVVGNERDLWSYYGGLDYRYYELAPCRDGELLVGWGGEVLGDGDTVGVVYDNGLITLRKCQ